MRVVQTSRHGAYPITEKPRRGAPHCGKLLGLITRHELGVKLAYRFFVDDMRHQQVVETWERYRDPYPRRIEPMDHCLIGDETLAFGNATVDLMNVASRDYFITRAGSSLQLVM